MTQDTLTQGEPWMTPQERDFNQDLIRAIAKHLEATGVPESALVALRVNDIASTWLLARRLESALAPREGQPAPCPTPAQADAIGKCRERLRKAIKELEEYRAKTGAPAPAPQGLVERMHEAVRMVRAAGFSTNNFTPINPNVDQETESPAPETPDSPNPENNAPETPDSPNPANNAPDARRQLIPSGDRQKSNAESRDKYRPSRTPQPAPATCDAQYYLSMPPGRQPPQDTG